jgi:hypothetical protein
MKIMFKDTDLSALAVMTFPNKTSLEIMILNIVSRKTSGLMVENSDINCTGVVTWRSHS